MGALAVAWQIKLRPCQVSFVAKYLKYADHTAIALVSVMADPANSIFRRATKISIDQFRQIKEGVLPFCDRRVEFAARLEQDGFAAFRPYLEFEESFCSTPEELSLHRRHGDEFAKIYVSGSLRWLLPFRDRTAAMNELYASPLIEELMQEVPHVKDANEHNALWLCDPCNGKREQLRVQHRADFQQRENAAIQSATSHFVKEAKAHQTGLGDKFGEEYSGYSKLIVAAVECHGAKAGLEYVKKKSPRNEPNFERSVNDEWTLRLILGVPKKSYVPVHIRGKEVLNHRDFDSKLFLCTRDQGRKFDFANSEILEINYMRFVPNFKRAYSLFSNNDQLETIVKAHLALLGYVIDETIAVVNTALK